VVVLGISGSLRAGSLNTALLRAAAGLVPAAARLPLYTDLALVPPYSEDDDGEPAPAAVRRLRAGIETADALLIATPEYNASVPGQLKNALDWASRPYPDNALRRKPVAVVGASTGLFGAVWAQAELRKVLTTAGADVIDDELPIGNAGEAFHDDLTLADRELSARLEHILANLVHRASAADARIGRDPLRDRLRRNSFGPASAAPHQPSIRSGDHAHGRRQ
jgi:chromate reductase